MASELVQTKTLGPTAIELEWDFTSYSNRSIDSYNISCQLQQSLTQQILGGDGILSHVIRLDLAGNSTTTMIQGLLPARSYNCCVTPIVPFYSSPCTLAMTADYEESSELSTALVGFVGGVIGVVITLLVIAAIVAIMVLITITFKKKRAVKRAKRRPILRTESTLYKRNTIVANTDLEVNTQNDSPPTVKQTHTLPRTEPPPTVKQTHTLPRTTREGQVQHQAAEQQVPVSTPTDLMRKASKQGQMYTVPNSKKSKRNEFKPGPSEPVHKKQTAPKKLKPMVPLKPQIHETKPKPLRRARSQPDSRGFRVDLHSEGWEPDHIYDTAEVSDNLTRTLKRIVSTENVAYTQPAGKGPNGEDWIQAEYEEIF